MIEENTIADFIRKTMPKDIPHVIIDVGANATAIFSSSFIDEEWDTFLIEPQPECVKCLKMLYKTATVINAACDIKKGYLFDRLILLLYYIIKSEQFL